MIISNIILVFDLRHNSQIIAYDRYRNYENVSHRTHVLIGNCIEFYVKKILEPTKKVRTYVDYKGSLREFIPFIESEVKKLAIPVIGQCSILQDRDRLILTYFI